MSIAEKVWAAGSADWKRQASNLAAATTMLTAAELRFLNDAARVLIQVRDMDEAEAEDFLRQNLLEQKIRAGQTDIPAA